MIFNSNEKKYFDTKPYLEHGIFKELQDEKLFKTVFISFDTVEWANGADLCPEMLYKDSN